MRLILASQSPRRKDILTEFGYTFDVCPSNVDEELFISKNPSEYVINVAKAKCNEVFEKNNDCVVLASDTIVTLDGIIYGKPKSKEEAYQMLSTFSGKTHEVISGVAIFCKEEKIAFKVTSKVTFKQLSDQEINDYLDTDEPYDKAGSYAIQGIGKRLISKFEGNLNNIIGLPIEECIPYLNRLLEK